MKNYFVLPTFLLAVLIFSVIPKEKHENFDYVPIDISTKNATGELTKPPEKVVLPIEVLGSPGVVIDREIRLTSGIINAADKMWFLVNNLSYQNKGAIKINNGAWLSLNHNTTQIQEQEKARGGMAHGGFNTIRFTIPANNLTSGMNRIRFRFNSSDGITIGYRVIKLNILDSSGTELLDNSYFENENPENWTAPDGFENQNSINQGKNLWLNSPLWNHYLPNNERGSWYAHDIPARKQMRARCTDCHTQDGRDLEMFSYSNVSIIERSKFHGLTENQGKQIAAYIRSLSNEPTIDRIGRPWNPPYQPGPELKGKPIAQWAAGAGLEAVLEKDENMLPFMFPNGITKETVGEFFDQDKPDMDRTTLPIAIQLPDWKHWLPMIHPKDALSKGNVYRDTYNDREPYINNNRSKLNPEKGYEVFRNYLEKLPTKGNSKIINVASLSSNQKKEIIRQHEIFQSNFRHFFIQQGNGGSHWRTKHGRFYNAFSVHPDLGKTSMARLMAVKNFELMNEFGLQDQMTDLYLEEDYPNTRQWLHGDSKHVWEIAPHITGCDDGDCHQFEGQSEATGEYETTAWYELQNIIAGGEGQQWWNGPVDYNYLPQFILKASKSSGIDEVLRYYRGVNSMYKTKSWSGDTNLNDGYGFRIRQQGPWRFFGKQARSSRSGFFQHEAGRWPNLLNEVRPGLSKLFLDALFTEFLKAVEKYPLENWPRSSGNGVREGQHLGPINRRSVIDITQNVSTPDFDKQPTYPDNMYWLIPEAIKHGVDCQTLDRVIDWCQEAWPRLNFRQFKGQSSPTVTLIQHKNCPSNIEAQVANAGNSPSFIWRVNGTVMDDNDRFLDSEYFSSGDRVFVSVRGVASCASQSGAVTDQITIQSFESACEDGPECAAIALNQRYFIKTNFDLCVSSRTRSKRITQRNCEGNSLNGTTWALEKVANSALYFIKNVKSERYLTSPTDTIAGTTIIERSYNGTDRQKWKLSLQEDCTCAISSRASGKCLNIQNGQVGISIEQTVCSMNDDNQQFSLVPLDTQENIGVSEEEDRVSLYPNPAKAFINIQTVLNAKKKILDIRLYDNSGKLRQRKKSNQNLNRIDLKDLPQGLYFVRIIHNKKVYVKSFIRN